MRVIARAAVVDSNGKNYTPGKEISPGGDLFRLAEYYERLGLVQIVRDEEGQDEVREAHGYQIADLTKMTVAELQELARSANVPYSGLRKAELVEQLKWLTRP